MREIMAIFAITTCFAAIMAIYDYYLTITNNTFLFFKHKFNYLKNSLPHHLAYHKPAVRLNSLLTDFF